MRRSVRSVTTCAATSPVDSRAPPSPVWEHRRPDGLTGRIDQAADHTSTGGDLGTDRVAAHAPQDAALRARLLEVTALLQEIARSKDLLSGLSAEERTDLLNAAGD